MADTSELSSFSLSELPVDKSGPPMVIHRPYDREEYLYQVDGTTDIHTPTDHSADDEDTEPDNKRQRKTYTPADTIRKDLTKQKQAQLLKNQQEKES